MGKPCRLSISHYHEPVSPRAYNGGSNTGWLETHYVTHATGWDTILGLGKQVLWSQSTTERIESENRTHFQNNLIDRWH